MKKLFVMMIALMFSSAVAFGCSSEEDAESTEVSSGSEYTEEQWGNAEQQATEGAEATEEEATEATEEAEDTAEEATE